MVLILFTTSEGNILAQTEGVKAWIDRKVTGAGWPDRKRAFEDEVDEVLSSAS